MNRKHILIIDQTIREGMQHRGMVFSRPEREMILKFQETLGVDICQAGYAPAHITEQEQIKQLQYMAKQHKFRICVAGMGRAYINDIAPLVSTDISHFHLHAHIPPTVEKDKSKRQAIFDNIKTSVEEIRKKVKSAVISIAVLDIGMASPELLDLVSDFLAKDIAIDILSLPDTSGIMAPDMFHDSIFPIAEKVKNCHSGMRISVHCHNDLGMASANTLMGVKAGATVVELSALGIGERNGIADLFTVGKFLNDQGYGLHLNMEDLETFRKYYQYISDICKSRTGEALLHYNTPFFGEAAGTHVAGTHAGTPFGLLQKEDYYLNVLCGRSLVRKYLDSRKISYEPDQLKAITENIKSQSAALDRCLEKREVVEIVKRRIF